MEFVLKKFGLSDAEFKELMQLPVRDHREFDTEGSLFHYYPILKPFKPVWTAFKSIRNKKQEYFNVKFKEQIS